MSLFNNLHVVHNTVSSPVISFFKLIFLRKKSRENKIVFATYVSLSTANRLPDLSDSPLDSDRTELLRVSDPVDYSGHASADLYFADTASADPGRTGRSRMQHANASRPQSLAVDQQWPTRLAERPPKNIFDDIWSSKFRRHCRECVVVRPLVVICSSLKAVLWSFQVELIYLHLFTIYPCYLDSCAII